jgi:hypothetical protein
VKRLSCHEGKGIRKLLTASFSDTRRKDEMGKERFVEFSHGVFATMADEEPIQFKSKTESFLN